MVLIGAIDQGTSSSRFLVFDGATGDVVASHQEEVSHITPKSGWLEEDPEAIYQSVVKCVETVLSSGKVTETIATIGITNQRESTIVWDIDSGKPLYNAIIWCDSRTQETVDKVISENNDATQSSLHSITGLPISTYFSALKLRWILDNCPEVAEAAAAGTAAFGTVDSWLVYKLSKKHVTDPTNACRTMLYDINKNSWSDELLDFFKIPKTILLPEIKPSSTCNFAIVSELDALKGIPITGILGDQQAALVGQKCLASGQLKNTYGTGCFLLQNTGAKRVFSKHGLLTTVGYQKQDGEFVYAVEGSIGVAGLLVRWLRDQLQFFKDAHEIERLAAEVSDSGGVFIVPAFSGLFCPYWASDARGVICGLTQHSNKNHIARAALDAVAWQVRDIVDAMRQDGQACTLLKADGGMTANKLMMQVQADVLQIPVVVPKMAESTALGAAVAAGMAVDGWSAPGWESFKCSNASGATDEPPRSPDDISFTRYMPQASMEAQFKKWKKAVERSVGWED